MQTAVGYIVIFLLPVLKPKIFKRKEVYTLNKQTNKTIVILKDKL